MKGRNPTADQKRFHDALCELGCIACLHHGVKNTYCSVHHIDGRTKPDAHWLVLALCGGHHQDQGAGLVAVHPWKARFERKYGAQRDLLTKAIRALLRAGADIPASALRVAGILTEERS